ncbi:hypothetical protein V6N00_13100 [Tersicoccus sp. MR15.9]|uniref:hypothetical protein n=1 Tax=Tersicoccus mangrovi TaxID=3121635 RepID=UPI002FE63565
MMIAGMPDPRILQGHAPSLDEFLVRVFLAGGVLIAVLAILALIARAGSVVYRAGQRRKFRVAMAQEPARLRTISEHRLRRYRRSLIDFGTAGQTDPRVQAQIDVLEAESARRKIEAEADAVSKARTLVATTDDQIRDATDRELITLDADAWVRYLLPFSEEALSDEVGSLKRRVNTEQERRRVDAALGTTAARRA